jgi:hypothetical protein
MHPQLASQKVCFSFCDSFGSFATRAKQPSMHERSASARVAGLSDPLADPLANPSWPARAGAS